MLNVIDNRITDKYFCEINIGDYFINERYNKYTVFLKIEEVCENLDDGEIYNAVCLNNGKLESFSSQCKITKIDGKFIME